MRRLAGSVSALMLAVSAAAYAEGSVKGKITFNGKAPKPESVKMSATPYCQEQHKEGFRFEPMVVGSKGELANVFVYVKKGLEGKTFTPPAEPKVVLDQKGCWYNPRIFGIMVGQKLQIKNSDSTMHNVNAQPDFNAAMPVQGMVMEKAFKKPKVMFKIKCNVHPWMTAHAGVVDNPFFAVSGKDGGFEIKNLPPGKYTLEAWHEKLGVMTKEVTLGASGATADFKFSAGSMGKS